MHGQQNIKTLIVFFYRTTRQTSLEWNNLLSNSVKTSHFYIYRDISYNYIHIYMLLNSLSTYVDIIQLFNHVSREGISISWDGQNHNFQHKPLVARDSYCFLSNETNSKCSSPWHVILQTIIMLSVTLRVISASGKYICFALYDRMSVAQISYVSGDP